MRKVSEQSNIKRRKVSVPAVASIAVAAILLASLVGVLVAKVFSDVGHDVKTVHDKYEIVVDVLYEGKSAELDEEYGLIQIKNDEGFVSGEKLPLQIDVYYTGASYTAIRVMITEQWKGDYYSDINDDVADKYGILPEPLLQFDLNEEIPLADNRIKDNYIYFSQYQTVLSSDELDTDWSEADAAMLSTSDGDTLYVRNDDGSFSKIENADDVDEDTKIWRKYSLFASDGVAVPELSDSTDGVYNSTVKELNLYVAAEGVQFNRIQNFWSIDKLPERTNEPEREEGGE